MKWTSFILAVYVLLLVWQPISEQDDCCANHQTEQRQDSSEKNPNSCCSPFTSCASCCGFTFPMTFFHVQSMDVDFISNIPEYFGFSILDYFPSIWQPPKLD